MDYDPNEDARRCYWLAIAEKRKAHVADQRDDWLTLPELYAWEAGPLAIGRVRNGRD